MGENWQELLRILSLFGTNPNSMAGMPRTAPVSDAPSTGGIGGNMSMMPDTPSTNPMGGFSSMFNPSPKSPFQNMDFGADKPLLPNASPTPGSPTNDVMSRMRELYQPETVASDRYNELLGQYPEYKKPGIWRSIAAGLSAFGPGGHDMGMRVANFHNDRAMEDWKNQIGPAGQAANLERYNNMNERQMAHQTTTNTINAERNAATAKTADERTRIAQQRANVYEHKTRFPDAKFDFSGPFVMMTQGGRVSNTGIPTGEMSEMDRIALNSEMRQNQIDNTQAGNASLEAQRQRNRTDINTQEGWRIVTGQDGKIYRVNATTNQIEPMMSPNGQQVTGLNNLSGNSGADQLPSQIRIQQWNNAREIETRDPVLGKYVHTGPGNEFTVDPISTQTWTGQMSDGPTAEQAQQINAKIFGGAPQILQPGRTGVAAPTTGQPPKVDEKIWGPGWMYVPKPGGGWTVVRDPNYVPPQSQAPKPMTSHGMLDFSRTPRQ